MESKEKQEKQRIKYLNKLRTLCISNSKDLIKASKLALNNKLDHISFHLSKLALEEIGKYHISTLEAMSEEFSDTKESHMNFDVDDHEKKLFFAIWSPSFGKVKQTKEEIEKKKGLAKIIQDKSLYYLYVEPSKMIGWKTKMEKGEAMRLYKFVSLAIKLEKNKSNGFKIIPENEKEELRWFLKMNEDIERRQEIFGHKSQDKLIELNGDVKQWIHWLKEIYDKNEKEMIDFTEKEIHRQKPSEEEAFQPKYKMRLRIQGQSHSIANDAFKKWNENVNDIKIYKSDKKENKNTSKSELIIDFLFPKAIHIAGLWDHGLFISKTFLISLNIATKGLFWWNVQKDIEKYFEHITDVEADKNEKIKIGMRVGKRLAIDWGPANMSLDQTEMNLTSMIFAYLINNHEKMKNFLQEYAMAMTLFSKVDIHLRLEVNAFDGFFKAFKESLIIFGDWDKKTNIKDAIKEQFKTLGDLKDLDKTIDLGISLENDIEHKVVHPITLTEVAAIKLYCDFYLQMKISEYFKQNKKLVN